MNYLFSIHITNRMFSRNHIIILLIILLVSISISLIMSKNIIEGNSPDSCIKDAEGFCNDLKGKKCKELNPDGLCSDTIQTDTLKVNQLNNSIMNFYEDINNTKNDKTLQSIQTNRINDVDDDDEELYILKSQIIPPVCPVCPNAPRCKNKIKKKCQPCPPCGKCPEQSFDCKKVPNYTSERNAYLPRAILSDFSQYGL